MHFFDAFPLGFLNIRPPFPSDPSISRPNTLVPGTCGNPRYSWRDETQSGYVEAPDSLGSILGIFIFSSACEVEVLVRSGLLPLPPAAVPAVSDPAIIYIARGCRPCGQRG